MRQLTDDDVPAIAELCPIAAASPADRGRGTCRTVPRRPARRGCTGNRGSGSSPPRRLIEHGFVRLLAVAAAHRRRGVGRDLLVAAEQHLGSEGVADVTLGTDVAASPVGRGPDRRNGHVLPGRGDALSARGSRTSTSTSHWPPCHADTGGWRLANAADLNAVAAFCARALPGLDQRGDTRVPGRHVDAVVRQTTSNHRAARPEPAGFCAFDGNRRGALGPVAVRPDLVGSGAGRAALLGALHTMRARGDDVAAVQWVGPLRPYVRIGRPHQPHLPGVPEGAVSDVALFPRPRTLQRLGGSSPIGQLRVRRDSSLPAQGYRLVVDADGARIAAADDGRRAIRSIDVRPVDDAARH